MPHQLNFEVTSAELKRTTKKFGKMDVYTLIQIGPKRFETKIHKAGDKNPSWKQKFEHTITKETSIGVELWENDAGKHILLAEGKQDLSEVSRTANRAVWVNVFFQKKVAGKVLMQLSWKEIGPDDGAKKQKTESQEQAPTEKKEHKEKQEIGVQVSIIDLAMVRRIQEEEKRKEGRNNMDKAVQANFWEIWETENQHVKDYEKLSNQYVKDQEKPLQKRCCSRCGSLPKIRRNASEENTYLDMQARRSIPRVDYTRKKEPLYPVKPIVREEMSTYRQPLRTNRYERYEDLSTKRYQNLSMNRDHKQLSRMGNFIMKNSFVTYDVYEIR